MRKEQKIGERGVADIITDHLLIFFPNFDAFCDELPNRPTALIESSGGSRRSSGDPGDPGDFPPLLWVKKKKKESQKEEKPQLNVWIRH